MTERTALTAQKPEAKVESPVSRIQEPELSQFTSSPIDRIMFLQRTIGNQAVNRLLKSHVIQAKLKVSEPGDKYEQEADRVAEQVIASTPQHKCTGKCSEDEEKKLIQRKTAGTSDTANTHVADSFVSNLGPGKPLDSATRAFFEPRFGYDFSGVRVHTDSKAAETARAVNARAFTVGRNIVFGEGEHSQGMVRERRLLAHELTHVMHQTRDSTFIAGTVIQRQVAIPGTETTEKGDIRRPSLTSDVMKEMDSDIENIRKLLKKGDLDQKGKIIVLDIIEKWYSEDIKYRENSGYQYQGTYYLNNFIVWLKKNTVTREHLWGPLSYPEQKIIFDALWYELDGYWLEKYKWVLSKSQEGKNKGPLMEKSESLAGTLTKQEAIGLWGMLKGMGTGLVGLAGPKAEEWIGKQFDESGEIMFGKEWSKGESLLLGMNASEIGTLGGDVIWQFVMLGKSKAKPSTPVSGKVKQILKMLEKAKPMGDKAKKILDVAGGLQGVWLSASKIAQIIDEMQKAGKLNAENLINDPEFQEQITILAQSGFAAVSSGSSKGSIKKAKIQLFLQSATILPNIHKLIDIGKENKPLNEKDEKIGKVLIALIPQVVSLAIGTKGYYEESGKAQANAHSKPNLPQHKPTVEPNPHVKKPQITLKKKPESEPLSTKTPRPRIRERQQQEAAMKIMGNAITQQLAKGTQIKNQLPIENTPIPNMSVETPKTPEATQPKTTTSAPKPEATHEVLPPKNEPKPEESPSKTRSKPRKSAKSQKQADYKKKQAQLRQQAEEDTAIEEASRSEESAEKAKRIDREKERRQTRQWHLQASETSFKPQILIPQSESMGHTPVRGATAEGVGDKFYYEFHKETPVPTVQTGQITRSSSAIKNESVNPHTESLSTVRSTNEDRAYLLSKISEETGTMTRSPSNEEELIAEHDPYLVKEISEQPQTQRLKPTIELPVSMEAARLAGVPDEVLYSGTIFTHHDFPDIVPERGLSDGRPAPKVLPRPEELERGVAGRRPTTDPDPTDVQHTELQADAEMMRAFITAAGGRIIEDAINRRQRAGEPNAPIAASTRIRPDYQVSYIDADLNGRRVTIEYDRAPGTRSMGHAREILTRDPEAIVIIKIIGF